MHADIMDQRGGSILRSARHRYLELARQVGEFRMEGRPLTDEFAPWARVLQLLRSHSREVVGRGVADAIAAGLNRVHFDLREFGQDIRNVLELGPVVLDVLASREMPVAAIVAARNA